MSSNRKIFISILVAAGLAVGGLTNPAQAADNGRFLVKTNAQFWKSAFSARHQFKGGFTADLNDWQLRFGKLLGLEIETVGVLQILPEEDESLTSGRENSSGKSKKPSPVRPRPSDQTPWGVEYMYNDALLTKTSGGLGVGVAVLDTGALISHPDLKGRVAKCKDFTNARRPVVDNRCEDKNGHGTHVAGLIAADGGFDGLGIYGVAPESSLYIFRVCSLSGSCYADDIAMAVRLAADEGAKVINLSLGADQPSILISEAIDYAVSRGVLVVAAAGNDGPYLASIDYPAAQSTVVAVGAFDPALAIANWSSRGLNSQTTKGVVEEKDLELAAPGVSIESTWKDGSYTFLSGTSMAAPLVSGLAAKYWANFAQEENPAWALRSFLQTGALDIDELGEDDASGFGFARVTN